MNPRLKYINPELSERLPSSGAPLMLKALAVSTQDDISIYGAASLTGQPLLSLFLSGLVIMLWVIVGRVNIKIKDSTNINAIAEKIGMYLFLNGLQFLKLIIVTSIFVSL